MAKLGDLVVHIGANTKDLNKKLGHVQRNMRSMTSNITKLGKSMSASLTLPLAAIAGKSLKLAVGFEASMAKVKAVSGATGAEFKSLEETAKKLGATTVFTASEVSGLMLEYSKLGFSATQINEVSEATLYLAQATGSDLAEAAAVAGATLGGFGLAAKETGRVTDVMAASFSSSALDITLFKDSMKFVAPVAKIAGVSLEETTAMLGVLANAGIKGSMAGTALRRIFGELAEGSGTVTEKLAKLSKAGLTLADSKDEVGRSAQSALLVLANGVPDIEKFNSALLDSGGAAKDAADIMNNTTEGALKAMGSALEGAALVIGDSLAPMLRALADWVADLATKFRELEPGTQKLIIGFGALVASLGPLLLILPQILAALPLITAAFTGMSGAVGLIVVGLVGLAYGIDRVMGSTQGLKTHLEAATISVQEQSTEVRYLIDQYKDESLSLEAREKILKRLSDIDKTHFSNLSAENTKYGDLVKSLNDYTAALRATYLEKAFADEGQRLFTQLASEEKIVNAKILLIEEEQQRIEQAFKDGEQTNMNFAHQRKKYLQDQLIIEERARDETLKAIENFEQRKIDTLNKYAKKGAGDIIEDPVIDPVKDSGKVIVTPAAEGSLNKLRETVATLTAKFNSLDMASEEFKATQIELAAATLELDNALKGLKDREPEVLSLRSSFGQLFEIDSSEALLAFLDDFGNKIESSEELLAFLDDFGNKVEDVSEGIKNSFRTLADTINAELESGVAAMIGGVALMVGAAVGAEKPIEGMGAFMGETLAQMAINIGQYAIAHGTVIEAIKASLKSLSGIGAIVAGATLIALGAGIKSAIQKNADDAGVPALAEGGLAYGPTLAMVGDNKGANVDPEIIAPLSKLKDMLGGNSIQVYGRISGDDIVISNNRASRDRNRF